MIKKQVFMPLEVVFSLNNCQTREETTAVSDLEFVKLVDECIENKKANI